MTPSTIISDILTDPIHFIMNAAKQRDGEKLTTAHKVIVAMGVESIVVRDFILAVREMANPLIECKSPDSITRVVITKNRLRKAIEQAL